MPFIRDGLEAGEPILVVVGREKIGQLQDALGSDAAAVSFADMAEVGRNPARIIPAWRDFLAVPAEDGRHGASGSRCMPSARPTSRSSASATRPC